MKNRDVARSFPWEKTLRLKRIQRKPNLLIRINQAVMVQCHSLKCPPGWILKPTLVTATREWEKLDPIPRNLFNGRGKSIEPAERNPSSVRRKSIHRAESWRLIGETEEVAPGPSSASEYTKFAQSNAEKGTSLEYRRKTMIGFYNWICDCRSLLRWFC